MAEYAEFGASHGHAICGGAVLYPTATTVRVRGARGGEVLLSEGPYAETEEAAGQSIQLAPPPNARCASQPSCVASRDTPVDRGIVRRVGA